MDASRKRAKPAPPLRFGELLRASSSPSAAAADAQTPNPLGELDLAAMSPLCHQLLETKKRMLSALAAESSGGARSDDDDLLASDKAFKASKSKSASSAASTTTDAAGDSALSPDAILQRKAQRRREQVRAASRRCRDRQRVRRVGHASDGLRTP